MSEPAASASEESRAGKGLVWKGVQLGITKVMYLGGTLVLGYLLTPLDFGYVAVALVATSSLLTATDPGMTPALVQAHESVPENYDVAWTIGLGRALLICALLFFGAPLIALLFGDARAGALVRIMSAWPVLTALASPRVADLIRAFRFRSLAAIAIASVTVETAVSIGLARKLGGEAIILGKLSGAATGCVASYLAAPYTPVLRISFGPARQLMAFGRWLFAIGLTAVLGDLFLRVLISRVLGVQALGLFSLADRLAEAPIQMAGEATGSVALALYARLRTDSARLSAAVHAHLLGVMVFLLPATALIVALAWPLEHYVLGPAWAGATPLIIILALAYAVELSFMAVSPLLQGLGAGRLLFGLELAQYIVLVGGVATLTVPFALLGAGWARLAASVVVLLAGAYALRTSVGGKLPRIRSGAAALLFSAIFGGGIAYLIAVRVPNILGIVIGGALGMAGFLGAAILWDRGFNIGIRAALGVFFPILAPRAA
ncbi:MAG TPA: oligosaccharide flippase family protein [Steroidobacteraceae bacterium]|nr:oligosaccharide flippase family protein [Steroidobacteraceae bacterium]